MKRIFLTAITLTVLLLSSSVFAELKGNFSINSPAGTIKEGDLIEGTMRIWPVENPDSAEFSNLINTKLFNALQLIQVLSVEPSANNADVLEMRGLFIAHSAKYLTTYELKYKNEIVAIEAPALKITPLETRAQEFFILDQSLNLSHYRLYIIAGILFLVCLSAFLKRKKLSTWLKSLKKDPRSEAIKFYRMKFEKASLREDYEELYARKEDWLPLIQARTTAYDEFFKVMNLHQYKPAWGAEELREVKSIFDIIRGSFK